MEHLQDEETAPAPARRSAAMRRRVQKPCAQCGMLMNGMTQRRYCSNRCAVQASRSRRAAKAGPSPIVERLNQTRVAIMRERHFAVASQRLLDEARDERFRDL